jgi:hypothetical protein
VREQRHGDRRGPESRHAEDHVTQQDDDHGGDQHIEGKRQFAPPGAIRSGGKGPTAS